MSCYSQYSNIGKDNENKKCLSYTSIKDFGTCSPSANPMAVCAVSGLDASFNATLGGSYLKPGNSQCQLYVGEYCAKNWDGICEYLSNDTSRSFPNTSQDCNTMSGSFFGSGLGNALTKGQITIRNAAATKYLKFMSGNCRREYQPFDPTIADSPLISKWVPGGNGCGSGGNCHASNKCIPVYGVDAKSIDSDPVMNKILAQPWIAHDILINIYNHAVRNGDIKNLKGTKLYSYFQNPEFQKMVKSKKVL